jgi:hypothetical protein
MWNTQDPRELIGKRARIVIVMGDGVAFADVEIKHGYSVSIDRTEPDVRRFVGADEPWPGWFWAPAPQR